MFPVEAFSNTVGKFVTIAQSLELPFHLTGGTISSAYGEPRLTQDIDIVISHVKQRLREFSGLSLGCGANQGGSVRQPGLSPRK